jgi:hypothetical protein
MIKSIRNRAWTLAGALEELVDNSLGHGHADKVIVIIDNANGIGVIDNGVGIDDINRIFRIGDASAHDDLAQIGLFGVGAKHATIYLGDIVTVKTVHDGRKHQMKVNWAEVEQSGLWPLAYTGKGREAPNDERGTTVIVTKLASRGYHLATSERITQEFGAIFAPAIRNGASIEIHHSLTAGEANALKVEPFNPADLTDDTALSGEVNTPHGILKWTGRAGLSQSLKLHHNGVHIAFGHRVIEITRDPFMGAAVPTLYAEVQLDHTTPWKHQLSEHKDKVVGYREDLIKSIHEALAQLIDKAEKQSEDIALDAMVAPIEAEVTKILKGRGLFHFDPEQEAGTIHEHDGGTGPGPGQRVYRPQEEGEEGREKKYPTGIKIQWATAEQLDGDAFDWGFSGNLMILLLDKDLFRPVVKWPPRWGQSHVVHLVVSFVTHAIESERHRGEAAQLQQVLANRVRRVVDELVEERKHIAPRLYRMFIGKPVEIEAEAG